METHERREGTAGIGGQLYEIKTSTLVLLNALLAVRRGDVSHFRLGTNVRALGAADDVLLRYWCHDCPRALLVQCKHRDNVTHRVTLSEVLKEDGDFALIHLLDTYLTISRNSGTKGDNVLGDAHGNIDIIMYTPAPADFGDSAEPLQIDKDDFILTNAQGKVFTFKDSGEHLNALLKLASRSRAKQLAQVLARSLCSGKGDSLLMDNLVQMYHVYLKEQVLQVSNAIVNETREVRFCSDFFTNDDNFVSLFRKFLYDEILTFRKSKNYNKANEHSTLINVNFEELEFVLETILQKIASEEKQQFNKETILRYCLESTNVKEGKNKTDVENQDVLFIQINKLRNILKQTKLSQWMVDKVLTEHIIIKKLREMKPLKVPDAFGNIEFKIKHRRLNHLSDQFVKMLQNSKMKNEENKIVRVNSKDVGDSGVLTKGDLQVNGGIGGLVGNLLVLDDKTRMLKLNDNEDSLPDNAKKLLNKIRDKMTENNLNLNKYRFQFNILGFPRLSWDDNEADKSFVQDFFNRFKFYSSQAKENQIDNIIKAKMNEYCRPHVNIDLTYLNVHSAIVKWWQQTGKAPYITETCDYFEQEYTYDLLKVLTYIHANEVTNRITFSTAAVQSLRIEDFISQTEQQVLKIITNNLLLSTIKVLQYFDNNDKERHNYCVIDYQYVLDNNLYDYILNDLQKTRIKFFLIKTADLQFLHSSLYNQLKDYKRKIVIVTDMESSAQPVALNNCVRDETNQFIDLTENCQIKLLQDVNVTFQGEKTTLDKIITNKECENVIDASVLHQLISKGNIEIGKPLADKKYNNIKDAYVDRNLCRRVKIKDKYVTRDNELDTKKFISFIVIKNTTKIKESNVATCQGILLISDKCEDFKELCTNYKHNVHWFRKERNDFVWQKSRGGINKLRDYVHSNSDSVSSISTSTIPNIEDKTVIIAAAPGMGKSCLLTHLSIATKRVNPSTWILRINLSDCSNKFKEWKNNNVYINEREVFNFLNKDIRKSTESTVEVEISQNLLEERLFTHYYNSGKITLICDGYDEINPDYKKETTKLLQHLNTRRVQKLWVTTRPYGIVNELENELSVFCYTLKPFSKHDQKQFLRKYFKSQPEYIDGFLNYISHCENSTFATPLNLKIIVKIFENRKEGQFSTEYNLYTLYKHFVDITIKEIYIREKSQITNENIPIIRSIIDDRYKKTIEDHKLLAAAAIACEKGLFNKQEEERVSTLINSVKEGEEKTGIVERIVDGVPKFVHLTFAEYFFVEYFCDKLKCASVPAIIWEILKNNRSIRIFFDGRLKSDLKLAKLEWINEYTMSLYKLILFNQGRSLLIIAIQEEQEHIVNFCSNILKISSESQLPMIYRLSKCYYLFQHIFLRKLLSFVLNILDADIFKNPVQNEICLKFIVHILNCAICTRNNNEAERSFSTVLKKVIENGYESETLITYLMPNTPFPLLVYAAVRYDKLRMLWPYLSALSEDELVWVATAHDDSGWTLAHSAAQRKQFDFFNCFMNGLKDKTKFRLICLGKNKSGESPLYLLLKMVKEINRNDDIIGEYSSLFQYICPNDDETSFTEEHFRDLYIIAAECKALYLNQNLTALITKMLDNIKHYYGSGKKEDLEFVGQLLSRAIAGNNDIFIESILQHAVSYNRIAEILITNTSVVHEALRHGCCTRLLRALSRDQLEQVVTIDHDDDSILVHKAAELQDFILFDFLKDRMNKINFKTICLSKTESGQTVMRLLLNFMDKNDIKCIEKYMSLYDYLTQSENQDEIGFDEIEQNLYEVVSKHISYFNENRMTFVVRMLNKIKHYCGSANASLVEFGSNLLHHAITTNNGILIDTLLQYVEDPDRITEIMLKQYHDVTLLHSAICQDVSLHLLRLDRLSGEQLVRVTTAANDRGRTPAHQAAVLNQFIFFEFIKSSLNINDFKTICFAKDKMGITPMSILCMKDEKCVERYMLLWEYICFSNDELEVLGSGRVSDLLVIVTGCTFTDITREAITQMLESIQRSCGGSNQVYVEFVSWIFSLTLRANNIMLIDILLQNLSEEQLVHVATAADEFGWTSGHEAAIRRHFEFFYFFKNHLNKTNFRNICSTSFKISRTVKLSECGHQVHNTEIMLMEILADVIYKGDDECVQKHLSLCEYLYPSDQENIDDLTEDQLLCMYQLLAQRETLFLKLKRSKTFFFIINMLSEAMVGHFNVRHRKPIHACMNRLCREGKYLHRKCCIKYLDNRTGEESIRHLNHYSNIFDMLKGLAAEESNSALLGILHQLEKCGVRTVEGIVRAVVFAVALA